MQEDYKTVSFPAPSELVTAAKLDAIRQKLKFGEWWRLAGEKYLAERPPDQAA